MVCNQSYYGGFRTRTFADIFPSVDVFHEMYTEAEIPPMLANERTIDTIYYLLYARYGNSHIGFSDENQFAYSVLSTIFMYGPTWEKRLEIQKALRELDEDELLLGSKAIYNHAFNPSTVPSTDTVSELPYINDQNTTTYKKSKLVAYNALVELLETDVTENFINKFKKLFIVVLAPDYPLLYKTTEDLTDD
jgi:hypothetical protein